MEISDTTPDNGAEGIALKTTISVVFDEEADPYSIIDSGSFIVAGSTSKLASTGPGLENLNPVEEDLLISPVFTGLIEGAITTSDNLTFTFTPKSPLLANSTYRVILSSSIVTNTIGDVEEVDGNTSTGYLTVKGPYTGVADDTFTVEVTTGGVLGVAQFTYTKTSTGLASSAITTDRSVELEKGVFLNFKAGTFVEGDSWTFDVTVGEPLEDIYEFSFSTGSSTHVEIIEDTPSFQIEAREVQGISRIDNVPSSDSGTLGVSSILPFEGESNVRLSNRSITIEFNKNIDADSLTDADIEVIMETLPLDLSDVFSSELKVTASVSGKKLILTFSG